MTGTLADHETMMKKNKYTNTEMCSFYCLSLKASAPTYLQKQIYIKNFHLQRFSWKLKKDACANYLFGIEMIYFTD